MSGRALARMRPDLGIGALTPRRAAGSGWPQPGSLAHSCRLGREIRLRKTCKTERAAQIELGKLLEQAAADRQPETDATVAQPMDRYSRGAITLGHETQECRL